MVGLTLVLRALLLLLPFVSSVAIEQASTLVGLDPPVLPDQDPFYKPPAGFESAAPGTIFRYRLVKNRLTFDNKNGLKVKNQWQILYRTQTATGQPEANVVTLLEPFNSDRKKLFVYHWFSDAAYNGCNPSITMQVGTRPDNEYTQLQNLIVVGGLNKGWWVMVADDTGPQAAFGSGPHVGYATLDAIRATQNSANFTKFNPNARIGSYGYSGGGLAAGWFGEMHPIYAPEIKIDGMAMGGIIPNATHLVNFFNKQAKSSYGPPMIMGLARDYKNLSDWVNANVRDDQRENLYKTYNICYDSNFYNYTNMDLGIFFKGGFADLHSEVPSSVFRWAGTMGLRATPIAPWYIHGTSTDDSSPIEIAEGLYEKYCANGANIYFEKNITPLNHSEEMVAGIGGAIAWVADRLDGKPAAKGCKMQEVQKGYLQGLTDSTLASALWNDFLVYMGSSIGPSRPNLLTTILPAAESLLDPFDIISFLLRPVPGSLGSFFPQLLSTLAPGLMNYIGGAPLSAYGLQTAKQGSQGSGNDPAPLAVIGGAPAPAASGPPKPGQPGPLPDPKPAQSVPIVDYPEPGPGTVPTVNSPTPEAASSPQAAAEPKVSAPSEAVPLSIAAAPPAAASPPAASAPPVVPESLIVAVPPVAAATPAAATAPAAVSPELAPPVAATPSAAVEPSVVAAPPAAPVAPIPATSAIQAMAAPVPAPAADAGGAAAGLMPGSNSPSGAGARRVRGSRLRSHRGQRLRPNIVWTAPHGLELLPNWNPPAPIIPLPNLLDGVLPTIPIPRPRMWRA